MVDGAVFEGEFRHGKRHGDGVIRLPSGKTERANWEKGRRRGYSEIDVDPPGAVLRG
jgi:hypothetical protein